MAFPETDRERAWTAVVLAAVGALVVGSLVLRDTVYGGFVWHYFWGPVYADAQGAHCAVWNGGNVQLLYESATCRAASEPVAYPGYTLVSEVGYAVTLLVSLVGVSFLLDHLEIGESMQFLYSLFPFVLLGGALRVVEDANNAAEVAAGAEPFIGYPLNSLIISPVIYFVMFAITLAAVVVAIYLARRTDVVEDGYRLLAGIGTVLLAATVGFLGYLAVTTDYVEFHPIFTVLTLGLATVVTVLVWLPVRRYLPSIAAGTPLAGALVLWGHAVDGVANVVGLDWAKELGLRADLVPKHPLNAAVVDITQDVLPASVIQLTGDAWPFLVVKVVAVIFVLSLFDEELREEAPRYTTLMLLAVLAVGLGPGSRDMLRATFAI
ncbi:DUF63 family protein [Halobacterium litoreum]|uniref:DUF63 family protein n=1 Tax=Halobacterium litoreum TaxID=2039234 RepID=A0ABD5NC78_9EURY|nr:DUF63 family protein [Halobacterium litoreum]UHH14238.1 DUF63 family protein [Halobacterium litoreum]